jgi:hypothetical protein
VKTGAHNEPTGGLSAGDNLMAILSPSGLLYNFIYSLLG